MAFGCVDHMESKDDETKTRCGLTANHVGGYVWGYGAIEAYCQKCRTLHKKDIEKLNKCNSN